MELQSKQRRWEELAQINSEACPRSRSFTFKKILRRGILVNLEMQIEWMEGKKSSSTRNGESKQEWLHYTVVEDTIRNWNLYEVFHN